MAGSHSSRTFQRGTETHLHKVLRKQRTRACSFHQATIRGSKTTRVIQKEGNGNL